MQIGLLTNRLIGCTLFVQVSVLVCRDERVNVWINEIKHFTGGQVLPCMGPLRFLHDEDGHIANGQRLPSRKHAYIILTPFNRTFI